MFSCKTNCEEVDISQARRLQSSKRTGNFEKRCYSEAEVTFATRSASSQILSAQCTRRQSDLRPRFFYQPGGLRQARTHTGSRVEEKGAVSNIEHVCTDLDDELEFVFGWRRARGGGEVDVGENRIDLGVSPAAEVSAQPIYELLRILGSFEMKI